MRQFAIGDIHGCNQTLQALLHNLHIRPDDEFYFLGDYIDRGPDSKGVLDTIFQLQADGHKVVCLRGNHEQMMIDAFSPTPDNYYQWLSSAGGITTHRSFLGVDAQNFQKYMDFIKNMPLMYQVGDYILVHGGLNFNQTDPLSIAHQMMWLRDWYSKIDLLWLGNRYILHGHTPIRRKAIEKMHLNLSSQRVLNLDCGCVFNFNSNLRHLACFELQSQALFFQENIEGDYDY